MSLQSLQDLLITCFSSIEDVVASGIVHGAQSADIYGCLYFYLSDQFRILAKRLREFKLSFKIFDEDPIALARNLDQGLYVAYGLPKDIVFDRIDCSNVAESNGGVSLANVLENWAPFLNKSNPSSTLLGGFSNWASKQPKSQPGPIEMQRLTIELIKKGGVSGITE